MWHRLPLRVYLRLKRRLIICWCLALSLCTVAFFYFIRSSLKPFVGLAQDRPEVKVTAKGLVFQAHSPTSPGLKAGLVPGEDVILAINSSAVTSLAKLIEWETNYYQFAPVKILVQNMAGIREVEIRPELSLEKPSWFSNLFFIIVLASCALYVLFYYYAEPAQLLFAFCCLGYMVFVSLGAYAYENILTLFFWSVADLTAWLIILILLLYQTDVIRLKLKRILCLGVTGICLLLIGLRVYFYLAWRLTQADEDLLKLQTLFLFQNSTDFVAYFLFIALLILCYFRTQQKGLKYHLEWIAAGSLLALPAFFFFNQLPLLLGSTDSGLYTVGQITHSFLAFLPLFYVIGFRQARGYRFLVFHTRTIIYLFSSFCFLGLFIICYSPLEDFLLKTLSLKAHDASLTTAIGLLVVFLNLQGGFIAIMERNLSRKRVFAKDLERMAREERAGEGQQRKLWRLPNEEQLLLLKGIWQHFGTFMQKTSLLFKKALALPKQAAAKTESRELDQKYTSLCLKMTEFKRHFDAILNYNSRVCLPVSLNRLLEAAGERVHQKYADFSFVSQGVSSLKIFCCPEEIVLSLAFIFENAWEAQVNLKESIEVSAERDQQTIKLKITDKGEGLFLRHSTQLGQPFFSTKKGHLGLGLYLARLLLNRNGFEIDFTSKKRGGLTVSICFNNSH